jgi:lipopolysaccharide export system protein LptA
MSRLLLFFTLLLSMAASLRAQFANFSDKPVEITADGDTRFENGTAVADNNVQIHYAGTSIFADHAEYNPDTRDILLVGNVRIYSGDSIFSGQRTFYNLETKKMRSLEFEGSHFPLKFRSLAAEAFGTKEFKLRDSELTTSDSSMPDWHVRAKTIRVYTNDRVIFLNSTLYVGKMPVFWLPYAYSSLTHNGLQLAPGYDSGWGAYLLTSYTFPIGTGNNFLATVRQDYRTLRGYAIGFDANLKFGKHDRSIGKFISYYANDQNPTKVGGAGELPEPTNHQRYRVSFKQKLYLTDDIYATFDINKLSDQVFMQDFYPSENRFDPQPDNNINLTKLDDIYSLSLLTRWQMNSFQETTERKPELALDVKQEPLFGLPLFYDGTTSVGQLNRKFSTSTNPSATNTFGLNYGAARFDTLHQVSAPMNLFGWLSTIPTIGVRGTFYSSGGYFQNSSGTINTFPYNEYSTNSSSAPITNRLVSTGNVFRPVFNASLENSFKVSRGFEGIQSGLLGLDGVRHVFQPYSDLSYVYAGGPGANQVLQFDRLSPNYPGAKTRSGYQPSSTQLEPLNFPQFAAIDAIDTWAIWRLGARNRLQTRRDGATYDWLFLDSFADINGINPYLNGPISNLNNRLTFAPVSWFNLRMESQVPIVSQGFSEFNTYFDFMPVRSLDVGFGTRYLNNYNGVAGNNQYPFSVFWRANDHWSMSAQEIYNTSGSGNTTQATAGSAGNALIYQRYMIHRDLSSWVLSFGAEVRANQAQGNQGAQNQYGVLLSFTLKDLPQVTLPLAFSAASQAGSSPISPSAQ